ncbi:MAG TPA: aminoglycoside phosphotransferase family protein [Ktedonosporobacter sp.]|nr:aminoglycoside phosphotransferase family protein [Ktedonosporobacter sp.]
MSMIQHVPLTPDLFPQEIKAFLGEVHTLAYPRQGYTSNITIVGCERGTYVVKHSPGEQFSNWLAQEHRVLQGLKNVPLPLPQPYHYMQRYLSGAPEAWLVMGYLPGNSLREIAEAERDQAVKRQILYAVGQALAKLHSLPVPPSLLAESQEPWLDRMLKQAQFNLQHYEVDGDAQLLQQLERQRPSMVPPTLIHGDFAVDNVLIADGKVSGIIDWAWGAVGDPRYDLTLAIRPKEGIFPEDIQAFLDGYGSAGLSEDEYEYFTNLYEFF